MNNRLRDLTHLPNTYTILNSVDITKQLIQLNCTKNYRLLTLDIKDLYVNIPIHEVIQITRTTLQYNNMDKVLVHQITH
jgi:hypothetical protein